MSLGWKTDEVDEKIHEKYPGVEAGSYLRVCRIMEKSLYGQMELEAYEMRTIDSFMEKLQEIDRLREEAEAIQAEIGRLKGQEAENRCPTCGASTRAEDAFCRECGGKLSKGDQ